MPQNFLNNQNQIGENVIIIRDRLFHTLFVKFAIVYARHIPQHIRKLFEFTIFIKALVAVCILTYVHLIFVKSHVGCLDHIIDKWPRDGILRVEIIKNASDDYNIEDSYRRERGILHMIYKNQSIYDDDVKPLFRNQGAEEFSHIAKNFNDTTNMATDTFIPGFEEQPISTLLLFAKTVWPSDEYVLEYSLEYGFLRLSPSTRQRLNISIMVVTLDPEKHPCFGGPLSRFLLEHFHGYDNVLMASIKYIAEKEENKGYLCNVITGQHYRYVKIFTARSSYIMAIFIMLTFTIAISMILRYSHQQLFFFIIEILQRFEHSNISITFPMASLLTVILALVGLESIMAEFFNDTTTTFYIILVVWLADQYDSICCITPVSKKHWLRFFYLYHFFFYAYHYRFNGQYNVLAFLASWLFIQHSMIYFFHHYELPAILRATSQAAATEAREGHARSPSPSAPPSSEGSDLRFTTLGQQYDPPSTSGGGEGGGEGDPFSPGNEMHPSSAGERLLSVAKISKRGVEKGKRFFGREEGDHFTSANQMQSLGLSSNSKTSKLVVERVKRLANVGEVPRKLSSKSLARSGRQVTTSCNFSPLLLLSLGQIFLMILATIIYHSMAVMYPNTPKRLWILL